MNEEEGYIGTRMRRVYDAVDSKLLPAHRNFAVYPQRFAGRVAVITGAASGIGMCTAARLSREGARIVAVDRDAAALAEVVADLSRTSPATGIVADLTDEDEAVALGTQIRAEHIGVDILVNSAGISRAAAWNKIEAAQWDATFDINLRGAYLMVRELAPSMAGRAGRVVNVASGAAKDARPNSLDYAASKAALVSATRSLARALAAQRTTVNAVCPGGVLTEIAVQPEGWGLPGARGTLREEVWGRPMDPREVVALICFLASDEAGYISGQAINIDDATNVIA